MFHQLNRKHTISITILLTSYCTYRFIVNRITIRLESVEIITVVQCLGT